MQWTILGSGFGLGFYIPSLLLCRQLEARGHAAEAVVFESYLKQEKQEKIAESRWEYHANFAVALVAQRLPADVRPSIDWEAAEALFSRWEEEDRRRFVVLSGHWIYLLDRYRERMGGKPVEAELLYVDAGVSPSWKSVRKYVPDYASRYREVGMYDAAALEVLFRLPVTGEPPVPYAEKENRLVLHGGGWGMGTYLEKRMELEGKGFALDIITGAAEEAERHGRHRFWMNDPCWEAWRREGEPPRHTFPRFGEIRPGEPPVFTSPGLRHGLYELVRGAKAIVSKPGGATLIDSLASGTPVVFLDPFGPHEAKNAELWIANGFGISYEAWKDSDYSLSLLESLHVTLRTREGTIRSYVDQLCMNDQILKSK
ncbi:hypothetical protein [Paenibacillus mucilaginosus]|uniref:UDP-glucuronosyltransferase n=1 Tax=Paenibacillus mucilaginosus (strain KNP414) TaxID=1036673 RepID=F8F6U1_PAEMK|nr:hypothetical protein [Paenibacillus mucilaginosus]AEI43607.1 hypothetical protein KNP414_05083 [Paenibacillus mucilaginosus KNP414]MCG7216742.1 UDP-glucuronosyltransferase [Paenibacillus mucilaginosus]WDM25142.1 UDP-glucuronosyltransferase [Paenibacillus mucilaginosus]